MDILIPLESDPNIFNDLMHRLGVSGSANMRMVEFYSIDEHALPKSNVLAVIVVFPVSSESSTPEPSDDGECVWFMKQFTRNACGMVALIHALANNQAHFTSDGWIGNFFERCISLSPRERGITFDQDEEIRKIHSQFATSGQSSVPEELENVDLHFSAYVPVNGHIYELDGSKEHPINCGCTSTSSFLKDAISHIKDTKRFESICISIMALIKDN